MEDKENFTSRTHRTVRKVLPQSNEEVCRFRRFYLEHLPDIRILLTVNFEEDNTTDSVFVSEI